MRYHDITKDDMLNGDGLRVVLWVAGCPHKCKSCQNPTTWNPEGGILFDDNAKNEIFEQLEYSYIDGITFSGGDPLSFYRKEVNSLISEIKQLYPDKSVWCYTGYSFEEVEEFEDFELSNIDVLVDGNFVEECHDDNLLWKGSLNQRVIDVKQSLLTNTIVLHCNDYSLK